MVMTEIMQVFRGSEGTCIHCDGCFVGCEASGKTMVEALVSLPCSLFSVEQTADAKEERDGR